MAADASSWANVIRAEMAKDKKRDPQLNYNPLGQILSGGKTTSKFRTVDVAGKVDYEAFDTGTGTPTINDAGLITKTAQASGRVEGGDFTGPSGLAKIWPNTPDNQFVPMYRISSGMLTRRIFVPLPRALARLTGTSVQQFKTDIMPNVLAGMKRSELLLTIQALLAPRVRNPIIENDRSGGSRTVELMPFTNNFIPQVKGSGSAFTAELKVQLLWDLEAVLCNALGKPLLRPQMGIQNSVNPNNRIFVFSNSGFVAFLASNGLQLGDKDYFGKALYQNGPTALDTFLGTTIITIPDASYMRWFSASTATDNAAENVNRFEFGLPARNTDYGVHTATGYTTSMAKTAGHINTRNMHSMFIIYPDAISLAMPEQFTIPGEVEVNPQKSNELGFFSMHGIDYLKSFNHAVYRVFFTGPDQNVSLSV